MYLLIGLVCMIFFLPASAQEMYSCNTSLYQKYLDYRYCINDPDVCGIDTVRSQFFSRKQSLDFIEKSIDVDRDLVAIEYYYEACNDKDGEIFLGIVRSDGTVANSVIDYVYEDQKWVQLGEQLFLYSDVLGMDFIDLSLQDITIVNDVLVDGSVLECLSSLIGSKLRRSSISQYRFEVKNCYMEGSGIR